MSPLPRALSRARLWTSGLLTASTLLVGGLGVHLAQDHAASVATSSGTTSGTSGTSGTASGSSASSDSSSSSSGTDASSSSGSSGSDTSNQPSGFSAVAPLSGSVGQAQSGSGGS